MFRNLLNDLFLAGFLSLVFGPAIGIGIVAAGRSFKAMMDAA
jgi:hypothetical protein